MFVKIDQSAGFCPGVVRAIKTAEEILEKDGELYCIGDLVHNENEINRLQNKGLKRIQNDKLSNLAGSKIMIRAHGEPPETYNNIAKQNIELVDNTCTIVKKIQQKVREEYTKMKKINGQIVIYGKKNHPEVIGLNGQTNNEAIIIEKIEDIDDMKLSNCLRIFSQTTMNSEDYRKVCKKIFRKLTERETKYNDVIEYDSICRQVGKRVDKLQQFAHENDVIIFVSSKKSSNGRYLYGVASNANSKSYWVASEEEIDRKWFKSSDKVGVSGATSTPPWLLEKVAEKIKTF